MTGKWYTLVLIKSSSSLRSLNPQICFAAHVNSFTKTVTPRRVTCLGTWCISSVFLVYSWVQLNLLLPGVENNTNWNSCKVTLTCIPSTIHRIVVAILVRHRSIGHHYFRLVCENWNMQGHYSLHVHFSIAHEAWCCVWCPKDIRCLHAPFSVWIEACPCFCVNIFICFFVLF